MPYAIATAVYGIVIQSADAEEYEHITKLHLTKAPFEQFDEEIWSLLENEIGYPFFQQLSNDAGDYPPFFGIVLCQFNECKMHSFEDLQFAPTADQITEFNTKFAEFLDKISPEFAEILRPCKPTIFISWASS